MSNPDRRKIIESLIFQFQGDGFQDFCDRLGLELFPDDYHPVRAGGAHGDTKNDGYCPKARIFFAAHATRGESAKKTKNKIESDLDGCVAQHRDVRVWRFLTNDTLTGEIDQYIDNELRPNYPKLTIEIWGHKRLADEIDELDPERIEKVLGVSLSRLHQESRSNILREEAELSRAHLVARWEAAGVETETAESLADDESIGTWTRLRQAMPDRGLVVIQGDFGSGKSVTAERLHAQSIKDALASDKAAIPVRLTAQIVNGSLLDQVREEAARLGDPRKVGVHLVVDGLDEPGPATAARLFNEARTLVHFWPNSRIVVTVRPGLLSINPGEDLISHPSLTDEEAMELAQRLGVRDFVPHDSSLAIREMLHLPLFAIVAALRYKSGADIPQSRGAFLQALADEALKRANLPYGDAYHTLKRLAYLAVSLGGAVPIAELDEPGIARLAQESRLVVKDRQGLRFSLPVLEQYFAAQAVLESGLSEVLDGDDLALLDKWRYPLMLAITVGSWQKTSALLERIIAKQPALVSWLVAGAIPNNVAGSDTPLPNDLECGRRLHRATHAWVTALEPLAPAFHFTNNAGAVRTLGVHVANNWLTAAFKSNESADPEVMRLPIGYHPFMGKAQDGSRWGPGRGGGAPAEFAAWPWRWGLKWVSDSLESLLKAQALVLSDCKAFVRERRWALAQALVGKTTDLLHKPIEAEDVQRRAEELLALMAQNQAVYARLGRIRTLNTYREELQDFIENLSDDLDVDGRLHRPYPVPDTLPTNGGLVEDLYTHEALRDLVEQVYGNALLIYHDLVAQYFPRLKSTLGLACILPISLQCDLLIREDHWIGSALDYMTMPLAPSKTSRALVNIVEKRAAWRTDFESIFAEQERIRRLIVGLHPDAEGWARPRFGQTAISVFRATPATSQAYRWLWEDLKELHLVEVHPPFGEDW